MKVYRFADPGDSRFAEAARRGSWTDEGPGGACPECSASRMRRSRPLIVVWRPGSNVVGDFVWPGFDSEVVVTDRVLGVMEAQFAGFEPGPVVMEVDEEVTRAQPGQPFVTLPYTGPLLHELWVTSWVHLDRGLSSVELERRCSTCATEFWEVYGVERWDSHFDSTTSNLVRTRIERLPHAGVYIPESRLEEASIFRVCEFPGWVFCTESVRDRVEEYNFSLNWQSGGLLVPRLWVRVPPPEPPKPLLSGVSGCGRTVDQVRGPGPPISVSQEFSP